MKLMHRDKLLGLFISLALVINVYAKTGYGPGEQDWGFIDVRRGAHMFYWLYKTTANVANYTERPLVIWLQGGPGASSTGYGNFEEFGPLDVNGNFRNWTWVEDVNVLFIDNPVGTGFSYVDSVRLLAATNKQIALDLVQLMKGFFVKHPEFESVPLHIFGESYGGKMAPEFALELFYAIHRKEIKSELISAALGNPWVSPIDSVLAWAPFLWNMGIVDQDGCENIMSAANKTLDSIEHEQWIKATRQLGKTQNMIFQESKGVDSYNIETPTRIYESTLLRSSHLQGLMERSLVRNNVEENEVLNLETLMRGPVSKALDIPSNVKWGSQSQHTSSRLSGDFMKPVIQIVNELLNNTSVKVGVFSGQLDLVCATPGTVNWIDKLRWRDRTEYLNAPRQAINVNGILEGYFKSVKNFFMFWVNRAGHMVPVDNPPAMRYILRKLTNFD